MDINNYKQFLKSSDLFISNEIKRLLDDETYLSNILFEGFQKADKIASKKIKLMKEIIGF